MRAFFFSLLTLVAASSSAALAQDDDLAPPPSAAQPNPDAKFVAYDQPTIAFTHAEIVDGTGRRRATIRR